MFTPPPSPMPWQTLEKPGPSHIPELTSGEYSEEEIISLRRVAAEHAMEAKRATGRRHKWMLLAVPAVLVLITLSTRYISHPAALDAFADPASSWPHSLTDWSSHSPHKRSPQTITASDPLQPTSNVPSTAAPASTTSVGPAQQAVPTVPVTPPVLPNPFPQPFDTSLSSNFSTQGCDTFFQNMTSTAPFRSCRAFSLLQGYSSAFIKAQENLTELNDLIWGTCNTATSYPQCVANMGWFAEELQEVCSIDLQNEVATVVETLMGLQAFSVMHDAACSVDSSTNSYCYVEAFHSSNPSDSYFYQLPYGINLPNGTVPTCNTCTQNLMDLYVQPASNGTLPYLKEPYENAATLTQNACGPDYVENVKASSAGHIPLPIGVFLCSISVVLGLLCFG